MEPSMSKTSINKKPNLLIYGEVLINEFSTHRSVGGAPFNVARTLSLLGDRPLLISKLGKDDGAQLVRAEMSKAGLVSEGVQWDIVRPTRSSSSPSVATPETPAHDYIEGAAISDLLEQYFQDVPPDLIYFGALMLTAPQSKQALFVLLESDLTEGATKFLDLNLHDEQVSAASVTEALNYADIVKLNEQAFRFILAHCCQSVSALQSELSMDAAGLQAACEGLMGQFFMQAIIVNLDDHGYFYFDANAQVLSDLDNLGNADNQDVQTASRHDAFAAMFIHGWNQSWRMQKTLAMAQEFAAEFATEMAGTQDATVNGMEFYQAWRKRVGAE